MPQKTAADSTMSAPPNAVQHGVSVSGGLLGDGLVLVVVVLIGLIALGCGPPF